MEKVFVAKRVAKKLWATEDAIDAAIAQSALLTADLVQARTELKVSHGVIDPAMSKLAEAAKAMADARRAMTEAHRALDEAKLRIGVRTRMDGPKNPFQIAEEDIVERRAVRAAGQ